MGFSLFGRQQSQSAATDARKEFYSLKLGDHQPDFDTPIS
jgi:hypothetical protein